MATTPWENVPPTLAERYGVATGSSDLTGFGGMVPKGGGTKAVDLLIAAGLADSGLGTILMRLQDEWDGAAKPSKPGPRLLQALTGYIKREDDEARETARRKGEPWAQPTTPAPVRARERADAWYERELRLVATMLKSRKEAQAGLLEWAARKGLGQEAVQDGMLFWLSPRCPACKGHGMIGPKQCRPCGTTGNRYAEPDVKRVVAHIDYCMGVAKSAIGRAIR